MRTRKFYLDVIQLDSEVTGTLILVVVKIDEKTIKFIVDCGLFQEGKTEEEREKTDKKNRYLPAKPEEVDFMIITHNHVDHTGRIPYIVKRGFNNKIYMTAVTKSFLSNALYDSAKVMRDTGKRKNEKPLYDADDVPNAMVLTEGYVYNQPIKINENITLTFVPNGHLPGAAMVYVQVHCPGEDDINIKFTGDYNDHNLFYDVPKPRKWMLEAPLTIVTESTYGDKDSNNITPVFNDNVLSALKENKTIVIPVFSLGRAQEILYYIKKMKEENRELFKDVPIYYDGKLSIRYTGIYHDLMERDDLPFFKDKKDFIPEDLVYVTDKNLRKSIVSDEGPKIIITTSGMGSYGPAQMYIRELIKKPNVLVHFTGYCAEGTLGYRMKFTEKGDVVEIGGIKAVKKADVEFTEEFSAHARADTLIKMLQLYKKPQLILVNHGRDESKDVLSERILKEVENVENVGILGRGYGYRINSKGLVKTFTSKFL